MFRLLLVALALSNTGCLAVATVYAIESAQELADKWRCVDDQAPMEGVRYQPGDECYVVKHDALECGRFAGGPTDFDRGTWDQCMLDLGWDVHPRLWPFQPYGELRQKATVSRKPYGKGRFKR